ncbi:polyamine aminopropyltransferase [Streptomyces sp. NPDC058373]|uniref:polyamine aminopropyltransferase n=1 Tax=Streptomyces sp. NPDC058373 TaxID=3346465 RepID=UPI0036671F9E
MEPVAPTRPAPGAERASRDREFSGGLPVGPGPARLLVLATVFVCAACGLVYELELVALASYLMGDSVTQASVVLSVMVFAMGVGALLAKRLRCRAALGFGVVEAILALVGGVSALALYACFAWSPEWLAGGLGGARFLMVAFSLLIGAEVPLLMVMMQRIRRQDAGGAVADLFAADYVGALVGGLAFPFLLLPMLGQLTGALLTGAVNAFAGGALVLGLFGRDLSRRSRRLLILLNVVVLALLGTAAALVGDFEAAARRAMYGTDVRLAVQSEIQEIVLTGGEGRSLALYLDGRLRVSGADEHGYHEALVHPAMAGPHARVLILGGGDGLAAREVLRHPGVRRVDLVELDPAVVDLARRDPGLAALNGHAYGDPRLRPVTADPFDWLRAGRPGAGEAGGGRDGRGGGGYDVIVADLPHPGITSSTKLYSEEFFGLAARSLAPGGRLAVHSGSPADRPKTFWTVDATVRAAGLLTTPYSAAGHDGAFAFRPDRALRDHPKAPDWGFLLAGRERQPLTLAPPGDGGPPLTLDGAALRSGGLAAEATRLPGLPPSTLSHPRYPH